MYVCIYDVTKHHNAGTQCMKMYTHTHTHTHTYTFLGSMYENVHTYIYTYIGPPASTHQDVGTQCMAYAYIYIYIYIYIYTYIYLQNLLRLGSQNTPHNV